MIALRGTDRGTGVTAFYAFSALYPPTSFCLVTVDYGFTCGGIGTTRAGVTVVDSPPRYNTKKRSTPGPSLSSRAMRAAGTPLRVSEVAL